MYHTGDKPGEGYYQCINCDKTIHLDQDTDTLPPCSKCHETEFAKIG